MNSGGLLPNQGINLQSEGGRGMTDLNQYKRTVLRERLIYENLQVQGEDPGRRWRRSVCSFPYDVEETFGTKGKIPIKAAFNGVSYSGSLIKYGHRLHMLGMPKAIREQTQTAPGDMVRVELWKDEEPRTIQPPAELKQAMISAGGLEIFDKLSYTHRKEYCRWISEAKKEETRRKRIAQATEMLKKGIPTPDAKTGEKASR